MMLKRFFDVLPHFFNKAGKFSSGMESFHREVNTRLVETSAKVEEVVPKKNILENPFDSNEQLLYLEVLRRVLESLEYLHKPFIQKRLISFQESYRAHAQNLGASAEEYLDDLLLDGSKDESILVENRTTAVRCITALGSVEQGISLFEHEEDSKI